MLHLKQKILLAFLLMFSFHSLKAQTNIFAQITNAATPDLTNWVLYGDAAMGDTPGDADSYANEVLLTPYPGVANKVGQIFYQIPINLTTCTKWKVEYDVRCEEMSGVSDYAADGIAFCAIDQLPTSMPNGQSMGIPLNATGLKVCIDTYDNNGCGGNNPEIQIGYGAGYDECDANLTRTTHQNGIFTSHNLNFLKDAKYDHVVVTYNNGTVTVVVTPSPSGSPSNSQTQTLTKNITPLNNNVYFGFTASCGMFFENQSIRNVTIYADVPATNDAGLDQIICSGKTVQLGTATTANHTYTWTPATNLSSSTISNPTATLTNTGNSPIVDTYTVKTERVGAASCYMVDTVKITVEPTNKLTESVSFCQGSSTTVHGQTISTDGTHTFNLTGTIGCDTTLTVYATYLAAPNTTVDTTICQGKSITFDGTNYTTSGQHVATYSTSGGCDSIVTLNLTVTPAPTSNVNENLCYGGTVTYNGQSYSTAGTYPITLQTAQGCDSIVSLKIIALPQMNDTLPVSICQGNSYTYDGTTYTTAGFYTHTFTSQTGCDSTVVLNLKVLQALHDTIPVMLCYGTTYTYNGNTYSSAGYFDNQFTSSGGCDSIVTVHITELPELVDTLPVQICAGTSYTYNGNTYNTSGVYQNNFTSVNGCDSVIYINLSVENQIHTNLPVQICSGDSYTFDGTSYSTSGNYDATFTTASGCDSIVTLQLTVLPELKDTTYASICPGQTYTFNGTTYDYTQVGTYDAHFTSVVGGCDSIQTLVLTPSQGITAHDTIEKCPEATITYQGQSISTAGDYPFVITATQGCDTNMTLTVVDYVLPPDPIINQSICPGDTFNFEGTAYTTAGSYVLNKLDEHGCAYTETLQLTMNAQPNKPLVESNLPVDCYGDLFKGAITSPDASNTYSWYLDSNATATATGTTWQVTVTDQIHNIYVTSTNSGCESPFTIIPIQVSQLFNDHFEVPNVITPNNDGVNDQIDFEAIFGGCVNYKVMFFNRWGLLVSTKSVFAGKDDSGKDLAGGVYFYKIVYDGGERDGFVTVVRDK